MTEKEKISGKKTKVLLYISSQIQMLQGHRYSATVLMKECVYVPKHGFLLLPCITLLFLIYV